jgi:hypothetical protein
MTIPNRTETPQVDTRARRVTRIAPRVPGHAAATGPARNRIAPLGDIIAVAGRGAWVGNRGRLHEGRGTRDVVRTYQSKTWVTCLLSFKDRWRPQWQPNQYTHLFFLDEAVAFAVGHRPCAECRRADHKVYRAMWTETYGGGAPSAAEMNDQLHRERTDPELDLARCDVLPDGVFVVTHDGPAVVVDDHLAVFNAHEYTYGHRLLRPTAGTASVITPASNVAVLRAGYRVQIDDVGR